LLPAEVCALARGGIQLDISPADGVLLRYGAQMAALGDGKARVAMARALNHEGRRVFTAVKRTLKTQTSAPSRIVEGQLKYRQPSQGGTGALEARIEATGSELPLKEFKPRQFKTGARAKVWGRLQSFPATFMGPRPGVVAGRLGGHVFVREGKARLPIGMVFGPSLPKEIVKDASAEAFLSGFGGLADRVGHELGRMLPG
jgi:hypothetical protein